MHWCQNWQCCLEGSVPAALQETETKPPHIKEDIKVYGNEGAASEEHQHLAKNNLIQIIQA